mmetsp:Transcript_18183/g.35711  ORF Transcript_18183/g.35711 Transcript_18183/m.35711 type:complete len:269 (+) Transcript_18183:149-955(+)
MQRYRVTVPLGVGPGQSFLVNVSGQKMRVTCPAGVYSGMELEIQAPVGPPSHGHHHHGGPPAPMPPPPPQPGAPPPAMAQTLGQQCQASIHAENQLRSGQQPTAGLIFSAMDRDGSNSVTADELQFGLSQGGKMDFSLKTCRLLINLYDTSRDGSVDRTEFEGLWGYLQSWRQCFEAHDTDHSGVIGKSELIDAIRQTGYQFSDKFFHRLFEIYGTDKAGGLGFDMFVSLFCELHKLTEAFKKKDTAYNGNATFQYEEFLDAAYSIHT